MSQSNFEQVVMISPSAASSTARDANVKVTRVYRRHSRRTSLSRITARNLRAYLLVVNQPFFQAPHHASAVMERSLSPGPLCLVCMCDLPRYIFRAISQNGVQVVGRSRVVSSDVFSVGEGERRKKAVSAKMRLQRRLRQLLRCPSFFDLLCTRPVWSESIPSNRGKRGRTGGGVNLKNIARLRIEWYRFMTSHIPRATHNVSSQTGSITPPSSS